MGVQGPRPPDRSARDLAGTYAQGGGARRLRADEPRPARKAASTRCPVASAIHEQPPTSQPLEPSHLPKVRNQFADFPQLHCIHRPETVCHGDLLRICGTAPTERMGATYTQGRSVEAAKATGHFSPFFFCFGPTPVHPYGIPVPEGGTAMLSDGLLHHAACPCIGPCPMPCRRGRRPLFFFFRVSPLGFRYLIEQKRRRCGGPAASSPRLFTSLFTATIRRLRIQFWAEPQSVSNGRGRRKEKDGEGLGGEGEGEKGEGRGKPKGVAPSPLRRCCRLSAPLRCLAPAPCCPLLSLRPAVRAAAGCQRRLETHHAGPSKPARTGRLIRFPVHRARQDGKRARRDESPHARCPRSHRPSPERVCCQSVCVRLTRGQQLLSRKPSPLQSSIIVRPLYLRCTRLNSRYCHQDLHHRPLHPALRQGLRSFASASLYTPSFPSSACFHTCSPSAGAPAPLLNERTVPRGAARGRQRGARAGLGVIRFWS